MVNFGQQKLDKEIMRKKSKATTPQQRAKELNLIVRKLKNKPSPYQSDYYANGKRVRRCFKTYEEAVEDYERFLNTMGKAQSALWTRNLTIDQVCDVNTALNMLPQGKTLVDAVKMLLGNCNTCSLSDSIVEYKKTKEKLSAEHYKHISVILRRLLADFEDWKNINDNKYREWLLQRGASKTIRHYFTHCNEFFEFSLRRGFIEKHPAMNVITADLPKVKSKKPQYFSVDQTRSILNMAQESCPEFVSWLAIGFFTGIRHAEINRLKLSNFDFERKEILLQGDIVKTGDSWLMTDIPDNLWSWLAKYKEITPMDENDFKVFIRRVGREIGLKWYHNGLRHSFATYHLSLYRDSARTSIMLRHRNKDTLWQHYLGGLVSSDVAKEYFSIVP